MGREAQTIGNRGFYTSPSGQRIDVSVLISDSKRLTSTMRPETAVALPKPGKNRTRFIVRNESALVAARRLDDAGLDPVALNFASL
jgi:hypothetical protein